MDAALDLKSGPGQRLLDLGEAADAILDTGVTISFRAKVATGARVDGVRPEGGAGAASWPKAGNDDDDGYLAMGVGATPQDGAIDVDFFAGACGLTGPRRRPT